MTPVDQMTERELSAERDELEKRLDENELTPSGAQRLAEVRVALRYIRKLRRPG